MTNKPTEKELWELLERQVGSGEFQFDETHDQESLYSDPDFVFESLRTPLAEQIYRAMEEAGLNENQLAKKLGVSRQAVNEVLNLSTNMTLKSLAKFCVALNRRPALTLLAPGDRVIVRRHSQNTAVTPCDNVVKINRRSSRVAACPSVARAGSEGRKAKGQARQTARSTGKHGGSRKQKRTSAALRGKRSV